MILIPYPFPLRPDLTITIELPDNLTGQEIDRLQRFIGTLGSGGHNGYQVGYQVGYQTAQADEAERIRRADQLLLNDGSVPPSG